jgi:hypothetical protein
MIATFDVFRTEADGSVKWFGAFTDLEAAKARIEELISSPGDYFIYNQATGNKLFFNEQRDTSQQSAGNDREDISSG